MTMIRQVLFGRLVGHLRKIILASSLFLSACGGGGGGDDTSSAGAGDATASEGIRILHAVLDEAPFVLSTSLRPGATLHTGRFAISSRYSKLSRREQTISLSRRETPDQTLFSLAFSADSARKQNILVYGNGITLGVAFSAFASDTALAVDGMAAVRVVHALVGAQQLKPSVSGAADILGLDFGGVSAYTAVTPGTIALSGQRVADSLAVYSGSHEVKANKSYTFLVTGEIGYFVAAAQYED